MSDLNKVMLIGRLTRDPEVKMTPSGQSLAKFSLATSRTWKEKDGTKRESSQFHTCVVWGKQAEIVEQYLRKGRQVYVEGEIEYRKSGEGDAVKYYTDIKVSNFNMLGSAGDAPRSEAQSAPAANGGFDDDIPF